MKGVIEGMEEKDGMIRCHPLADIRHLKRDIK